MWSDEAWLLDMLHARRKVREHTEGLDEPRFHYGEEKACIRFRPHGPPLG
jgi:hypothetical protein